MRSNTGVAVDEECTAPELEPTAVYEALVARRISYDQMMWQVPTLGITAQALLMGVGLDSETDHLIRLIALFLASGAGLLTLQLMGKQRYHEQIDTRYLQEWESANPTLQVKGFRPHDPSFAEAAGQTKAQAFGVKAARPVRWSSYRIWSRSLAAFTGVTAAFMLWVAAAWVRAGFPLP